MGCARLATLLIANEDIDRGRRSSCTVLLDLRRLPFGASNVSSALARYLKTAAAKGCHQLSRDALRIKSERAGDEQC